MVLGSGSESEGAAAAVLGAMPTTLPSSMRMATILQYFPSFVHRSYITLLRPSPSFPRSAAP